MTLPFSGMSRSGSAAPSVALANGPLYACRGGAQAKEIFDFYKARVPSIITLILGAYFRHARE
jgi:hypothetical protein